MELTVSVISNEPMCKDDDARIKLVPLTALHNYIDFHVYDLNRIRHFKIDKFLHIIDQIKVSRVSLLAVQCA